MTLPNLKPIIYKKFLPQTPKLPGPVNTQNKAAVRTLTLDGNKAGTFVMPQRGKDNWDDKGMSNKISLPLEVGLHRLGISYLPEDENMNIKTNNARLYNLNVEKVSK